MSDAGKMMRFEANKKTSFAAYALWFFFGMLGAHRFYLERTGTAVAILLLTLGSFILMLAFIGFLTIAIPGIWVFIDAFLIPGMVKQYNNQLADQLDI